MAPSFAMSALWRGDPFALLEIKACTGRAWAEISTWEQRIPEPHLDMYCREKIRLEEMFSRFLSEHQRVLIKQVRDHKKLFVYLEGSLNVLSMSFLVEEKETIQDRRLLADFFTQEGFVSFHIYRIEVNFKRLMEIIAAHSNESYELVVFYTGHGSFDGLELDDAGSIIGPAELMICLQSPLCQ